MDRSPCPLDIEFADQIAALLAPPSSQFVTNYYGELIEKRQCHGLKIKQRNELEKGAYASMKFKEGELILKDQMLVGVQHCSNKVDCLVCSHCFCYIGSIEVQIGRKLYLQGIGLSDKKICDVESSSNASKEACPTEALDEENNLFMTSHDNMGPCPSRKLKNTSLPEEVLESLMNGNLSLPYTNQFYLPPVISCPGGCEEEHYCSELCAKADWDLFHSLLCTGESLGSSRSEALVKFIEHANGTNDIFILAAKVISLTISNYNKLKRTYFEEQKQSKRPNGADEHGFSLLLKAWKPISMGFKKRWWDCISLPDDVDCGNEVSFRTQMRDLAFTSLQLLKEAIFENKCAPLFSLEVYGHIIGMFELNNLDLVVASPVEDYFLYIDDLPLPKKEEAEQITQPFIDALGDEYSVCCQGTAFFPLQSCMNHSCHPNAKAFKRDEDRDGRATIIALRPITEGEEITISYIDEDLPYEDRQALLADYGFICHCSKCVEEEP